MDTQNFIYECSRKNAQKQISSSEWINVFPDGIKLNRGDTVRLLGSFINEDGDSQDIQILDNSSFTIEHIPYINADTVAFQESSGSTHTHTADYQMKLGDIASPAYTTDAFGIEPPYWAFNNLPLDDGGINFPNYYRQPTGDRFCDFYGAGGWRAMYDADTTNPKPNSGVYKSEGYDYAINDSARKIGSYMDTSSGFPLGAVHMDGDNSKPLIDTNTKKGTLGEFNISNTEQQYQIAHMCKLIYFPIFAGVYYESTNGVFTKKEFNDYDYLSVGDYISTYFISKYATTGNQATTSDPGNTFGNVNWLAGPRSVVGKILAKKKVYLDVYCNLDNTTRKVEFLAVYVYDFINPGSYKNLNDNVGKPRHGSALKKNGYQPQRNDNRNAGITWTVGSSTSYPERAKLMGEDYEIQRVNPDVLGNNNSLDSSMSPNESMLYETNTSLSFLWSCRGTDTRSLAPNPGTTDDGEMDQISSFVKVIDDLQPAETLGSVFENFAIGATNIKIAWDDTIPSVRQINPYSQVVFGLGNATIIEFHNYRDLGYFELVLEAGTTEGKNIGEGLTYLPNNGGVYWYPRQYQVKIEDFEAADDNNRLWKYEKKNADLWDFWGAIVRMNPENDNQSPYTPGGTDTHRLYIPFTQQTIQSIYKVKHFASGDSLGRNENSGAYEINPNQAQNYSQQPYGNPCTVGQVRLRQNFGVSTGRGAGGDSLNHTAAHKPVPYNLTDADGWGHEYTGKDHMLNQQAGNSYNDSVCSIHFQQPLTGSSQFDNSILSNDTTRTRALWITDFIYVQKYKTEIKPKPGYYNFSQVAEDINNQLHYGFEEYQREVGNNTTVNIRQRQPGVSPNVINGNFVHSYLPDITYGFLPITETIYNNNTQQFQDRKIEDYRTNAINDIFSSYNDLNNETTASLVSSYDSSINVYMIPASHTVNGDFIPFDDSLQLFRFNGAKLINYTNTNSMDHQSPSLCMTNRFYDMLNTTTDTQGEGTSGMRRRTAGVGYQTRGATNNFTYGGCVKVFVGAVNPTFKIDTEINRMVFEYLYTPYRPATDDTGTALTLVSGQAVPSAIIDSFGNGGITDSLSGVYFRDLVSSAIDINYYPLDFAGFTTADQYPINNPEYVNLATNLWNSFGFDNNQLATFSNNTAQNPFIYFDRAFVINSILYNSSDLDISINASNPFYSYCSLWLPPLQFGVEVESNEITANAEPITINTPFYLIGSDFPAKEYYGNKGTKLPVVGVCSRQFTSFGYAFDLSESSITWTIEENMTITSIHTKIYNNDMSIPLNLGDQSSIIYVIEKPQYYSTLTEPEMEEGLKMLEADTEEPKLNPEMFYYTGQLNYEAPLFYDDETDDEEYII